MPRLWAQISNVLRLARWSAVLLLMGASLLAAPGWAQEAWLVWAAPGKGLGQTQLLEVGAGGLEVAGSGQGLVAVHGARVWAVRPASVKVPVIDCSCLSDAERDAFDPDRPPPRCVAKKPFASLQLVDVSTGKSRLIAPPPSSLSVEEGEAEWRVELLGQVGGYLLAAEYNWESPCMAAHGGAAASFIALDLATGKPVELWSKAEHDRLLAAGRDKALAAIRAAIKKSGEDDRMVGEMADTLAVQAVSPAWDNAGQLQPRWLFSLGWDFASSDGVWGSYSRSAWVQVPQKIQRFSVQPLLPLPVRVHFATLAKRDPPPRRFGWSALQPAQRALVLAALSGKGPAAVLDAAVSAPKAKPAEPPSSGRAPGASAGQRAPGARAGSGTRAPQAPSGAGSGRAGR